MSLSSDVYVLISLVISRSLFLQFPPHLSIEEHLNRGNVCFWIGFKVFKHFPWRPERNCEDIPGGVMNIIRFLIPDHHQTSAMLSWWGSCFHSWWSHDPRRRISPNLYHSVTVWKLWGVPRTWWHFMVIIRGYTAVILPGVILLYTQVTYTHVYYCIIIQSCYIIIRSPMLS